MAVFLRLDEETEITLQASSVLHVVLARGSLVTKFTSREEWYVETTDTPDGGAPSTTNRRLFPQGGGEERFPIQARRARGADADRTIRLVGSRSDQTISINSSTTPTLGR